MTFASWYLVQCPMRRRLALISAIALITHTSPSSGSAAEHVASPSVLDIQQSLLFVPDRMTHYHVPGLSAACIHNGTVEWTQAFGVNLWFTKKSRLRRRRPLTLWQPCGPILWGQGARRPQDVECCGAMSASQGYESSWVLKVMMGNEAKKEARFEPVGAPAKRVSDRPQLQLHQLLQLLVIVWF